MLVCRTLQNSPIHISINPSWLKCAVSHTFPVICNYSTTNKKINLKKKASRQWLLRQMNDKYVKQARSEHWRCRSVFKLMEMDDKCNILKPGLRVIDCGAAPGSWSQLVIQKIGQSGKSKDHGLVLSIDRDPFDPVPGCLTLLNADITKEKTQIEMRMILESKRVDAIISDIAPNSTGHGELDHSRIMDINNQLLDLCQSFLLPGGIFLCKAWQGGTTPHFDAALQTIFDHVKIMKPDASRSHSAEIYHVAMGYQNPRYASATQPSDPTIIK